MHVLDANQGSLHHNLRLRLCVPLIFHLENRVEYCASVQNFGDDVHVRLGFDDVVLDEI